MQFLDMVTAVRLGLPVVFVVLVDRHLQLITLKQEHQGFPCYGTPLLPAPYPPPSHSFGVPVTTVRTVAEMHDALARKLQAAGPVLIEALIDPSEYAPLILRPHKLSART
jgi:thiamine pyrophosphate-dependent acetolactate synthase large subunit-like protein